MNLRVDLILDTEQRSGSLLNAKSLTRLATIAVPAIVLLILGWQVLGVMGLKKELNNLIMDWEVKKPQSEKARTLSEEFQTHKAILSELEGWKRSRLAWNDQLGEIVKIAPENVQLQSLSVIQRLKIFEETTQAREYSLSMQGKAVGREAETSVRSFEQQLSGAPAFTAVVDEVSVPEYAADPSSDAGRDDRVFSIQSKYKMQTFQEINTRRRRGARPRAPGARPRPPGAPRDERAGPT
jgi:hypothetical protein